jgi:hypothetical protein
MISYVQSAQLTTSGTSATLAFGSNTGAGHALIVAGRIAATTPTASCTDTQSNPYVHAGGVYNGNGTTKFQTDVFVTANSLAMADTVTYSSTLSGAIDLAIHEYSGLVTSNLSILDPTGFAASENSGSTSTTPSSGSTQPSNATCLLFGAIATDSGTGTFTAGNMGAGVTAKVRQNVSALLVTEDNTVFAPGLYLANGTLSVAENWSALLVSLVASHGYLSPIGVEAQFFSNAGAVLASGKIATYLAGTTTVTATYTDYSLSTANPNPIILSSAGRLPAGVWQAPGVPIKVVISDSSNNVLMTIDNIAGIGDPATTARDGIGQVLYPQTAAEGLAGVTVVNSALPPGQVDRYFANVIPGTTDATAGFTAAINQSQVLSSDIAIGAPVTVASPLYLASSLVIPAGVSGSLATCELNVVSGSISIGSGLALTIKGYFTAPRTQVFAGSGVVILNSGCCSDAYPEWWGCFPTAVISTGAGTTQTTEFQAAVTACAGGTSSNAGVVPLRMAAGYYRVGQITLPPVTMLKGSGRQCSGFLADPATTGIWFSDNGTDATKICIEDLSFYGNSANAYNLAELMRLGTTTAQWGTEGYLRNVWFRDCFTASGGSGFSVDIFGNVAYLDQVAIYGPTSPTAGASLLRVQGSANVLHSVTLTGSGTNAYNLYLNAPGSSVHGLEIEAPLNCSSSYAPLSIQQNASLNGVTISVDNSANTALDHLWEVGASATEWSVTGLQLFQGTGSFLATISGGNAYNIAKSTYFGGKLANLAGNTGGSGSYFAGISNVLGGTTLFGAAVSSVSVTLPWSQANSNYKIALGAGVGSGNPAAGSMRPSWSNKGTSGFTINLEAAPGSGNSVNVDWTVTLT